MTTARFRFLYAFLLLPIVIGGAQGGCKCKKEVVVETETVEVVPVEDPLKVVSIEPSKARTQTEMSGAIYGSGFKTGAKVDIGGTAITPTLKDSNTLRLKIPAMADGEYDVTVTNPDGTTSVLRRGYIVKGGIDNCKSYTVAFDFDDDSVSRAEQAESKLGGKVLCLKEAGSINIEGHADERGTTEYNLALGQRRAEAVKTYLSTSGISAGKIRTVSYGEERPVDTSGTESAWAKNRRADLTATE